MLACVASGSAFAGPGLSAALRKEARRYCELCISGEIPISRLASYRQQLRLVAAKLKGQAMRAIICLVLSCGLLMALVASGETANGRVKQRRQNTYYYSPPTTMTERQLRNQRGYERGEYYEH